MEGASRCQRSHLMLSTLDAGSSVECEHSGWRTVCQFRNVPLPKQHLIGLAAGVVLNALVPRALFPKMWIGYAVGWPLILSGLSLAAWAVAAAEDINLEDPDGVVVSGPYSLTRNPMYVAWAAIYIGVTLVANTFWLLALFPAVLFGTHRVVLQEERHLRDRFGPIYSRYASDVRRYL